MAELSIGDHAAAAERLAPAVEGMASMGLREPSVFPCLPDAAEALIALGRAHETGSPSWACGPAPAISSPPPNGGSPTSPPRG